MAEVRSPRILEVNWGRILVEGAPQPYRDARLYPGGSAEWDWRETDTHHIPGIQPADVQPLLEKGARVVILATGNYQQLQVCPETRLLLEKQGIEVHILPTPEAVKLYNRLVGKKAVGALIHTTC
ncbi:MAG: hypothetical protein D6715_10715 [Calditrichaeota bacterium]|nr:MAG: hypothetical protein D6715_10715 [Calditrichota bacterium]